MNRRAFFKAIAAGGAAVGTLADRADAAGLPKTKITRIRYYKTPTDAAGRPNTRQPLFNQSTNVVIVETDSGLFGVGEGGSDNTMEQCAGLLIGQDPFRTDRLWQSMYRSYFYPAGREKVHALGALDVALWDLKGKALGYRSISFWAARRATTSNVTRQATRRRARRKRSPRLVWTRGSAPTASPPISEVR